MDQSALLYLDYAAAAPVRPEVVAAIATASGLPGNASSPHAAGMATKAHWNQALAAIACLLGCQPDELVVTSGATESCNLAIIGALTGRLEHEQVHILTTAVEHPAVDEPVRALERRGARVTRLAVDHAGRVSLAAFEQALTPETAVVSLIAAHNETGAIQRIHRLIEAVRAAERRFGTTILIHLDASQWAAWQPLNPHHLGIDLMSLSGSKLGGPHAGLLYARRGTQLQPIMYGGGQQHGLRPGSYAVTAAAGLAAALAATWRQLPAVASRVRQAKDHLGTALVSALPGSQRRDLPDGLPNILHLTVPGLDAANAVAALSEAGILASTGAACAAADATKQARIHTALGIQPADSRSTLRFSLGWAHTVDDVARLTPMIVDILRRVHKQSAQTLALEQATLGARHEDA